MGVSEAPVAIQSPSRNDPRHSLTGDRPRLGSGLAWAMLPILVQHLPRDRERMGLREVQMAGRLGLTLRQYRSLEAGELQISNDLFERVVDLCGWPRGPARQ